MIDYVEDREHGAPPSPGHILNAALSTMDKNKKIT